MEEKLLKIINNYGVIPQLKHFNSEVFELNEAIITFEKSEDESEYSSVSVSRLAQEREHIVEEIADVMVMLEQFKNYYDISSEEITNIFWSKVGRQLDRIEKEVKDE